MTKREIPPPTPDRNWALFLDVDGTLIDIAPTPSAVAIPAELPSLLTALAGLLGGAVALVSGRGLDDLDRLFAPLSPPAAGQHGAEIRLGGGGVETQVDARRSLDALLPDIRAFAAARPGLLIEDKGLTLAAHCRLVPEAGPELGRFLAECIRPYADRLETIAGHLVFDVRPRGFSKGTAVEFFMARAPFASRRPVFVGDDRTDEDGFAAVLKLGGHAIRVGPEGTSKAQYRIADPARARAWLAQMVAVLGRVGFNRASNADT